MNLQRKSGQNIFGDDMELLKVVYTSALSVIVLFLLTKIMGKKHMSQLSMFDYINGITIGSIAAEMATALEKDYTLPIIAMAVYTVFGIGISYIDCHSIKANKFFLGQSKILYDAGTIYSKNLLKAGLSLPELLSQCRINGYFDISQLQTIILEPTGRLSFLPKADHRPATPADMHLVLSADSIMPNLIIDGHILDDNLKTSGKTREWLTEELRKQGISSPVKVYLATLKDNETLSAYLKCETDNSAEPFI